MLHIANMVVSCFSSSLTLIIMDSWKLQASATPQVACGCFGPEVAVQPTTCLTSQAEGASRWGTVAVKLRIPVEVRRKEVVCWKKTQRPRCPQQWAVVVLKDMTQGEYLPFFWETSSPIFPSTLYVTTWFGDTAFPYADLRGKI